MKAQSYFGGTKPKATGNKVRQVGSFSATPGVDAFKNNAHGMKGVSGSDRRNIAVPNPSGAQLRDTTNVKQAGTSFSPKGDAAITSSPGVNAFKNNAKPRRHK